MGPVHHPPGDESGAPAPPTPHGPPHAHSPPGPRAPGLAAHGHPPSAGPRAPAVGDHHAHAVADFQRRFRVSLALTVPVLALAPAVQGLAGVRPPWTFPGSDVVQLACASAVFAYGGWPFLRGLAGELGQRRPGMMTLVSLAITVAWSSSTLVVLGLPGEGFFWELATLVDVMLLGHWLERRSVMGASRALEALARLLPAEAHRLRPDGSADDVPVTALRRGDHVLVKPGERIPTDGVVVRGRTTVNEAMLTGESRPVDKGEGDRVIAGAVNGEAAVAVEVERTGDETYLAQVIELVRRAQASRSRSQELADRAARWLTGVALAGGAATLGAWLALGAGAEVAVGRMVTVMVTACPHALGLAVPLVVAVSTALAAGHGLLVRDRAAFEAARGLQAIVFDKTGTLTEGRFGVTDVIPLDGRDPDEVLRPAASLESQSEHPIAAGVVRGARERGLAVPAPERVTALPGRGAEGQVGGVAVMVVSPGYLREHGLAVEDARVREAAAQGKSVVYVLLDGRLRGAIALADVIRPESRQALAALKRLGLRVMMLTGDARAVAHWVARELELDEVFAEVLPDEKAATIRALRARGLRVAMTGDGVNDAPALVEADLGIAIGAGTDVAIESADVVLVRSDPRDVVAIVRLARATYRKMVQNLWWAAGYNVVALPLAAGVLAPVGVWLTPAVGALLMSLSTVIVAINARWLRMPEGG